MNAQDKRETQIRMEADMRERVALLRDRQHWRVLTVRVPFNQVTAELDAAIERSTIEIERLSCIARESDK